ncbi:FAD binding domain-containing protein [Xylaria nigripes]|nr:FAD binding domain-containing protein [Xylaria nigripes]
MPKQKHVDVLIVGAGPTGMTMALELVMQGISFRIIDKATERSPHSRALVLQPRTLEIFNRHKGIGLENLIRLSTRPTIACVYMSGKKVAEVNSGDIKTPGTRFPNPAAVSQCETERWLESTLAKHGVQVELGVEAKRITQDADGVSVIVSTDNSAEDEIRAKFVVGADGAHSVVRHAAKNLTFNGDAYPQDLICADIYMDTQMPGGRIYVCLGKGVLIVIPLKDGMVRLVVSRPGQDTTRDPKLEDFQDAVRDFFPRGGFLHDATWFTRFRLHHRGVNRYRDGRLFVAGDAAHIHSPMGGQGMNTGIQDAANLGWKLAAVLRHEKPDSFLDSYHNERHRLGQYLLVNTDKAFRRVMSINPIYMFLRNLFLPWILPIVMRRKSRIMRQYLFMTQLHIRYRHSDIVGTASDFTGPIKGGDRAADGKIRGPEGELWLLDLLSPECHHLMLFSGLDPNQASQDELDHAESDFVAHAKAAVKVSTIFSAQQNTQAGYVDLEEALHRAFGFDKAGYVLVRPDGYIAHIGPLGIVGKAANWL